MNTEIISIILAIIVFIVIALVGFLTDILKEPAHPQNPNEPPYSFSRLQLFLWTLVIAPAFAMHWGATQQVTLNDTGLILLGISATVAVTASVISGAQISAQQNAQNPPVTVAVSQDPQQPVIVAAPSPEPVKTLKGRLTTRQFWIDILMDDSGQLSLVRLQQLVFTLIYIVVYVCMFFNADRAVYPLFLPNAYILMGISTGSYLLGKTVNK